MDEKWRALREAVGGRRALAELVGVTESTIHRWSREEVRPIRAVRVMVNKICQEHGVPSVFEEEDHAPIE